MQSTEVGELSRPSSINFAWRDFPWWLVAIVGFLVVMGYILFAPGALNPETGERGENEFYKAFNFIAGGVGDLSDLQTFSMTDIVGTGISVTIYTTLVAFFFAMILGLLAGLGRVSSSVILRNLATTYVEFVRGVPTLVLIFTVAFVLVPETAELVGLENSAPQNTRAIVALAVIYGAYLAEIFRAGIESIPRGQMEAARSVGMSYQQAMRYIILPQAIRNIAPALGNDFIAMLKDSSLVSVLAVRDITQQARLYAGSSFRFRETYLVLTFLYLTMTLTLSLLLRWYEKRLRIDGR
ncbi:MAG TPA: amino acid ABC transporter permease [Anaerolineae bacterium]|nr:amino acid ABC transporter permease [Anaerolineae bacterium]